MLPRPGGSGITVSTSNATIMGRLHAMRHLCRVICDTAHLRTHVEWSPAGLQTIVLGIKCFWWRAEMAIRPLNGVGTLGTKRWVIGATT